MTNGITADIAAWGASLADARLHGRTVAEPPAAVSLGAGYALADRAQAALGTPAGWKIGATSAGAMAFLGIAEPIRGRLFHERIWFDGDVADLSGEYPAEAEPEIAFRLAHALEAGSDPLGAIGEAHAAAEIVRPSHPRALQLGAGFIVADNAAGLGALIGPSIPLDLLAAPHRLSVTARVEGGADSTGTADAVLGNPLQALAWLATALGTIPAGSWVLTGAMARAVPLVRGDAGGRLQLDAGPWGQASLRY